MIEKIDQVWVLKERRFICYMEKEFDEEGDKNSISADTEYMPEVFHKISGFFTADANLKGKKYEEIEKAEQYIGKKSRELEYIVCA
jgi:hypothetical protein